MKISAFFSSRLVGLDIQPHAISLIILKKIKKGFIADHISIHKFDESIQQVDSFEQWVKIQTILREWVPTIGLQGMPTALGLSSHWVRTQHLHLPQGLNDKEIKKEILRHVDQDLTTANHIYVDYIKLPHPDPHYMDVLFALSRAPHLSDYVEQINAVGLNLRIVDIDCYALKRAVCFALNLQNKYAQINAILHFTSGNASLVLFNQYEILLHHHLCQTDLPQLLTQLSQRSDIKGLAVCGQMQHVAFIKQHEDQLNYSVYYPELFASLTLSASLNFDFALHETSDLWMASGLAMRDVPAW